MTTKMLLPVVPVDSEQVVVSGVQEETIDIKEKRYSKLIAG